MENFKSIVDALKMLQKINLKDLESKLGVAEEEEAIMDEEAGLEEGMDELDLEGFGEEEEEDYAV